MDANAFVTPEKNIADLFGHASLEEISACLDVMTSQAFKLLALLGHLLSDGRLKNFALVSLRYCIGSMYRTNFWRSPA